METIEEILREMRNFKDTPNAKRTVCGSFVAGVLTGLAGRIEAAHKREQEDAIADSVVAAAKSASEVYEPHIQSVQVGNAAKMREVAEFVAHIDDNGYTSYDVECAIVKALAALSEPPRNCDRFNTGNPIKDAEDAYDAWQRYCDDPTIPPSCKVESAFKYWLFAEAKGEK